MLKLLLLVVCSFEAVFGLNTGSSPSRCSCVPDQWHGILMSTDREYNLKAGQESTVSTRLSVHYDYTNRKFAMTDLSTGSRALADYKMGFKFVIRDGMCHGVQTFEDMKQMCLPEAAQFAGQYRLGSSVLIDLWDFDGPFNTTMKTAVLHDECIPVTEEIYMYRSGYISVTNSMYLNVKVGEIDDDVFRPPADCIIQKHNPHSKRTDEDQRHDLWNALRQRLYIFN